jgi:tRNA dimethylallyltransferase
MSSKFDMLTILGPTAGGKTSVAARMAYILNGEIISADSRQVYRGMDLGTGKDLEDYTVEEKEIPYHLIDIVDAGYKYNVFEYQQDFLEVYEDLKKRNVFPVFCGGSGMYLDAILKGYKLIKVPANQELREELETKTNEELIDLFNSLKKPHNSSDTSSKKRLIRAIEIESFNKETDDIDDYFPEIKSLVVGIKYDRNSRRKRITERLKIRLDQGMIDEVKSIMENGVSAETLMYYGLEYKFITKHIIGEITYEEMFKQLETAIHQFAKRQMTWFRGMEKKGFKINWLDGYASMKEKTDRILYLLNS